MKILVVEDEQRVSDLLKTGLEENGYQVDTAADGVSGLKLFYHQKYDFILSDIVLPKMDGFEFCKEVRDVDPSIPILMLTALGRTDDKLEGFDAGADDYMTKPFDFRELLARISVLLRRQSRQQEPEETELAYLDLKIDLLTQKVSRNGVQLKLSPKEYELLEYLVRHADRVVSRREILENVWHTDYDPGTNFIDVYINYLRKKIDRDFTPKLIHTRTGFGFILTDRP